MLIIGILHRRHRTRYRVHRGQLRAAPDGRLDDIAAQVEPVLREAVASQLRLHLVEDVALPAGPVVGGVAAGARLQHGRVGDRGPLVGGQPALLDHAVQHVGEAFLCPLRVAGRVVARWRPDGRRQHSALRNRQLLRRRPEVGLGSDLDARRPPAEVDGVEVVLQDLLLGLGVIQLQRYEQLLDLAGVGAVLRQVRILRVLLGDRGATLLDAAAAPQIGEQRPQDALQADARFAVEAAVLGRQNRLLGRIADLVQRHQLAVLGADPPDLLATGELDHGRLAGRVRRRLGKRGERVAHREQADE